MLKWNLHIIRVVGFFIKKLLSNLSLFSGLGLESPSYCQDRKSWIAEMCRDNLSSMEPHQKDRKFGQSQQSQRTWTLWQSNNTDWEPLLPCQFRVSVSA